jgi:hypothetical protein
MKLGLAEVGAGAGFFPLGFTVAVGTSVSSVVGCGKTFVESGAPAVSVSFRAGCSLPDLAVGVLSDGNKEGTAGEQAVMNTIRRKKILRKYFIG